MIKIPSCEELFESMVYLGHRVGKRHPKMTPYLHTIKNGVHIIDLDKTRELLKKALDFVQEVVSRGGQILFVGTKVSAQEIVKKYATEIEMPYLIERWVGGLLTNFSEIYQLIEKLKKMEEEKLSGAWEKYPKKERMDLEKEWQRLTELVGGLKNLKGMPEAIYFIDLIKEKTGVREAKKAKVKTIGLVDTNCDPTLVDYPIPANDDAIKSIEIITKLIAEAVQEGKKERDKNKKEVKNDVQKN